MDLNLPPSSLLDGICVQARNVFCRRPQLRRFSRVQHHPGTMLDVEYIRHVNPVRCTINGGFRTELFLLPKFCSVVSRVVFGLGLTKTEIDAASGDGWKPYRVPTTEADCTESPVPLGELRGASAVQRENLKVGHSLNQQDWSLP